MRNLKQFPVWLLAIILFFGCDMPKEPNFTTSHKVEAPLLVNKTFQFMGDSTGTEVLIDTTSTEFDSLFTVDSDGFISLSREENFEFGDLNDAIPSISTDPTSFNAEVGELELGSFSSGGGNLGTASFQDLTGLNPSFVPSGTPLPAGSTPTPVNINVGNNTDFFVSATVKSGAIEISVTNTLGFNITTVDVRLNSGSTFVNGTTLNDVDHNTTTTGQITFDEGDILQDINVDIEVSWVAQNTQAEPGELIVNDIEGVNLVAASVVAAVTGQDFSTSNTSSFDAAEFQFTDASHFVELESGEIVIDPIENNLELAVETLVISFPDILTSPYTPGDSLVISYPAGIPAASGGNPGVSQSQNIDLAGYRLYALNNEVSYNISAITENTQDAPAGQQNRTISESQAISSAVEINNLAIARAFGEISPQEVVLGDDDPSNGTDVLDLFNETETELTEIDGLEDLSKEIDGLEFTRASVTINYTTNIGVPTVIYGAFLGVNGEGEEIYLKGLPGNETYVSQPVSGLVSNGSPIPSDSLIRFVIQPSVSGGTESFSVTFDQNNSGVTAFLNNLPSEIRFIGKAFVNENGGEASIATPLEFDPAISINLPLALRTSTAANITDTTETDALQDLPKEGDDARISEATLFINYTNGLPLGFSVKLRFLDEFSNEFLSLPAGPTETYDLEAAGVRSIEPFFAESPSTGSIPIALTEVQLNQLYRTYFVVIDASLNTSMNSEVALRAQDTITLSVAAEIKVENTVE